MPLAPFWTAPATRSWPVWWGAHLNSSSAHSKTKIRQSGTAPPGRSVSRTVIAGLRDANCFQHVMLRRIVLNASLLLQVASSSLSWAGTKQSSLQQPSSQRRTCQGSSRCVLLRSAQAVSCNTWLRQRGPLQQSRAQRAHCQPSLMGLHCVQYAVPVSCASFDQFLHGASLTESIDVMQAAVLPSPGIHYRPCETLASANCGCLRHCRHSL